ncbi:MAG: error-prone DNA polymerase [Actinobacteria bacterium]|nr:error-prone DNA polymerase [Actinomycetota bacterium]
MGFENPPVPWSELERRLGNGGTQGRRAVTHPGDGSDSPAWSRRRQPYEPEAGGPAVPGPVAERRPVGGDVPYAELHCHSNFSFLDGASSPEQLVTEAARLGLEALALTDHDGLYGVVRFAEAARAHGLPTVFGAEITLTAPGGRPTQRSGSEDPAGEHLLVLARGPEGYVRLSRAISAAQLAGSKGAPRIDLDGLAGFVGGASSAGWVVGTGCRKGAVARALQDGGPAAAQRRLEELVDRFGRDAVVVELWDHGDPLDGVRNDALVELASRVGVDPVVTNNVHYARPAQRRVAATVAAVRARRSLPELDPWLPACGAAHLRSPREQAVRFARYPGAVERSVELARSCAFDLALVAPRLPAFPVPEGHDEMSWLRVLVAEGAERRYGPPGGPQDGAHRQIAHELEVIEQLGFPGYFLTVWDIVEFCRRSDIFCQGRGSAANSVVCFVLGITNVDAWRLGLLFERFLSSERDGPPDIDLDIESGRREEVIQYVYGRYGRTHAAQVANVVTYRARSAVRDTARALGFAPGQQDAWARQVDAWGRVAATAAEEGHGIPEDVLVLAAAVEDAPRHLGIHSGGMVICDRPVVDVCPVEWASRRDRSVLQWDKDDCAAVGLVKFDLLGLGMLTVLHRTVDLVAAHHGVEVDLGALPQEDAVYDRLCAADTVGVFQVESRAQMATLPRLRPRTFYDLVIEIALIRPGPIQGGSVHPYIRRRNGREPVTYLHPLLEPALRKTLGVPLFQEQLMQIAIDVGGFTPAEADQLRQAMGSKRSRERMERLRERFGAGAAARGVDAATTAQIWDKLAAFANYGFPESHSVSFAHLVYASAWCKLHYPAAFCAALLDAQPMGFYSPHTIVQDARRHGVQVRTPDVNRSGRGPTLEPCSDSAGGVAVRLGIGSVRSVGADLADRIVAGQPYRDGVDLRRRSGAGLPALEELALAGALDGLIDPSGRPLDRRRALWAAGAFAQAAPDRLPGIVTGTDAPPLPPMTQEEEALADLRATGISPDGHPTRFHRAALDALGVVPAAGLPRVADRTRLRVAGVVTHRQRPATAGGTTFLNLEDETGLINVVVSRGCWTRHRRIARDAPALVVRGRLERGDGGVVNIVAERLEPLDAVVAPLRLRDFH